MTIVQSSAGFDLHEAPLWEYLATTSEPDSHHVRALLDKARDLGGLDLEDLVPLMAVEDPELLAELFATARFVKESIYGRRLVLFAPLYVSNRCSNECSYCAFRARNQEVVRRALSQEEIAEETRILIRDGHKRVLLVAGESHARDSLDYILESIATVYGVKEGPGEIRRVNVNIAPLTTEDFRRLKGAGIGTYQIFQETYHHDTYAQVHLGGRKTDYRWRVQAIDRAMTAGLDDCGLGVLFGLADWRFELLALMTHIRHLETTFGVGPHTISVPRLEPATGAPLAQQPPAPVDDRSFLKIVALLRLAVPYTGLIMSTRETAALRRETLALGVSQISAGSRTNPGGYTADRRDDMSQFSLGDHRSLDEVIQDITRLGYVPSFCTGCYRLGRTGADFMDLARPGDIKDHCDPNAASTFQEYLMDYATPATRAQGEQALDGFIAGMGDSAARYARTMVAKVRQGRRDVYR
ncbi:[FeFe] hydrogenase H-cluster radical SAM maturase HydG [Pararhodospirillum photometricum]|nr:[FeFe] hydrogenase H-cluster radical SAM maturase HydG [Pararhodospirillum photometricum]